MIRSVRLILAVATSLLLLPLEAAAWEAPAQSEFSTDNIEATKGEALKVAFSEPRGLWSFPDEDAEVAVVPLSDSDKEIYKIVLLYDADLIPPPGTVIGFLAPTASRSKWNGWLFTKTEEDFLSKPQRFDVTFSFSTQSEDASLVFEKPKGNVSWRINPLSVIPFLRRLVSMKISEKSDALPYGLHRKDSGHRLRWL